MNEMDKDPPIDEVRELRHQISARFNHDPAQLIAHYLKLQQKYKDRFIGQPPKKDTDQHAA
jgi:hypothetical protein